MRCFPFLCLHDTFLPWGNLGEPFDEALVPSMEDQAQQIPISLTEQVGDGGREGAEGSTAPQHAPLTASKFTFHTASRATGEPCL